MEDIEKYVELLNQVLGKTIYYIQIDEDKVYIEFGVDDFEHYDIHSLAHKCKNHAFDKGYDIVEDRFCIRIKHLVSGKFKIYEYSKEEQNIGIVFKPEYTFKACQWILDNEKEK